MKLDIYGFNTQTKAFTRALKVTQLSQINWILKLSFLRARDWTAVEQICGKFQVPQIIDEAFLGSKN